MRTTTLALIPVLFASSLALAGGSKEDSGPDAVESYNEGVRLMRAKSFSKAQRKFEEALKVKDFAEAHNNLAYCLRKQGEANFDEALKHYDRAVALKPALPEPYMYRGVLHVQMGHPKLAEKDLAKLRELGAERLSAELAYVIENGKEKEPEQFFGVSAKL